MMDNDTQNLIKTIIEKESWEDVIYYIVNVEKIDPWNVDLTKLCDGFIKFIRDAADLDFRIPAKIVFIAAILLRLKAEQLSILEEEKEKLPKIEEPIEPLGFDFDKVKLSYPLKRLPRRQVTLEELINALRRAVEIEKRREQRRILAKTNLQANIVIEEDITKRMEKLINEIKEKMKNHDSGKISFSQLLKKRDRDEIVSKFIPLLHLEKDEKIKTEQPELFRDIWIKLKK